MVAAFVACFILIVAVLGGWLSVRGRKTDEKPIKIVFFVFYFWLLAFAQMAIFALIYYILTRYYGINPLK
ncbi:MAG: hypothetical protein ACU84J_01270 [Gammaproteobacteria bacterium]